MKPMYDTNLFCEIWDSSDSFLADYNNTGTEFTNQVPPVISQQNVIDGSRSLEHAAMTGNPWVPIIGNIEFQELTDGSTGKIEEYMLAMQSLDNLRLSGYGIDNGGLFEKKAHELQTEADINGGPVGLVLQDGLSIRQNFCNIVNSI